MNYDLAKKLRDVGFPQKEEICGYHLKEGGHCDCGYLPTLEELIEACSPNFGALMHEIVQVTPVYVATPFGAVSTFPRCEGDTPSEAMANLYLALNK